MRLLSKAFLCSVAAVFILTAFGQADAQNFPRASQKAMIMQTVGDTDIHIVYHRPNKKERRLWGDKDDKALVPNGEVWRAGANEATVFEVSNDVMINGQKLPKGKYSFYTIPGDDEWTLIFNKTWEQWGTQYNAEHDALKVKVKPMEDDDDIESMTYMIHDVTDNTADVILAWGNKRVPFRVDVGDVNARILNNVKQTIDSQRINAAGFVFNTEQKDKYKMAISWLDDVLEGGDNYGALFFKARLQAAMGMKKEAVDTAKKAVAYGKANKVNPNSIAFLEGLMKEWETE